MTTFASGINRNHIWEFAGAVVFCVAIFEMVGGRIAGGDQGLFFIPGAVDFLLFYGMGTRIPTTWAEALFRSLVCMTIVGWRVLIAVGLR